MQPPAVGILLTAVLFCSCTGTQQDPAPKQRAATPTRPGPAERTAPPGTAADDDRPIIVAFGNSLTAGYGLRESESYPSQLQLLLDGRGYRYRVVNAGVSGDTTAQGLNRIQIILDYKPAVIIVELGPNDGLRGMPIESTRANLEEIITQCRKVGAKVVLAGMTLPPNYTRGYIRSFERIYEELARKYDLALIPFFLEGVAAREDLNLGDGIHPNVAGSKIVAENVLKYILPLLKK
jgi:acyl-CoA thioesterase I